MSGAKKAAQPSLMSRILAKTGMTRRDVRRARRTMIAEKWLSHLRHKPIGYAIVGPLGMAWRKRHAEFVQRFAENREACARRGDERGDRKAIKAHALARWRDRKEQGARRRREQRAIAKALVFGAREIMEMGGSR